MKRVFVFLVFLLFASTCLAADFSANLKLQTGDTSLDVSLKNINNRTSTPTGAIQVRREITQQFTLPEKEILFLNKKGYCLAEIYYLSLLAKKSGKPVNDVAALHSKGVGWGVLAKRLGVRPNELNKLLVKDLPAGKAGKKAEKAKEIKVEKSTAIKVGTKTKTIEKTQIKEKSEMPKMEKMQKMERMHTPAMEGRGGSKGVSGGGGKGKGR